jgi:DNA-binding transcriptional ArsR family regulator
MMVRFPSNLLEAGAASTSHSTVVETCQVRYRDEVKPYSHPSLDEVSLENVMQALADPCRVAIVRALLAAKGGEMACNEVPLQVVKATRSHHFAVLREAGLVRTRIDGTKCMTSIRKKECDRHFPGLLELVLAGKQAKPARKRKLKALAA